MSGIDLSKLSLDELIELKSKLSKMSVHRLTPIGAYNGAPMVAFIGSGKDGQETVKRFALRVAAQFSDYVLDRIEATEAQRETWNALMLPIAEASRKDADSKPKGDGQTAPRLVEKRAHRGNGAQA